MVERSTINVSDEARRTLAGYCKLFDVNQEEYVSELILKAEDIRRLREYAKNGKL